MKANRNLRRVLAAMLWAALLAALGCAAPTDNKMDASDDPAPRFDQAQVLADRPGQGDWYRSAVFMEIFVRSYQDSNGDGIGDLPGLTSRLPYLADLGIGGIWLMPIHPTPYVDSGYDVADYRAVNPDYGTLEDFEVFLQAAHDLGIRVLLDGVFNHTSSAHPWFTASASSRTDPKRDWYIWADAPAFDCSDPLSAATDDERWTVDPATGQMYFHYFRKRMPDLNFANPEVRQAVLDVVRFWLDRGVDGFRLDVAHMYFQDADHCFHHPRTHDFLKQMRALLDGYDDRALVGEVAGLPADIAAYLGDGSNELHMVFNFDLTYALFASLLLRRAAPLDFLMDRTQETIPPGGQNTVVLSNHDFFRSYDLLLRNVALNKLALALQMTLPGTPFIYYGQEIGMADGTQVVVDYRDAARTPMHWDDSPTAGFTSGRPWITLAANHETNNVAVEQADPESLLTFTRRMIRLRTDLPSLQSPRFAPVIADTNQAYGYVRGNDRQAVVVAVNFSSKPQSARFDLLATPWKSETGGVFDLVTERPMPDLTAANVASYAVELAGYGAAVLQLR